MSDLIKESNRLMLLSALRHAKPELLREILKEQPDEAKVVSGLRAHNDRLHDHLQGLASVSPEEDKQVSSNVQPTRRRPFDDANDRVTQLFRNGGK